MQLKLVTWHCQVYCAHAGQLSGKETQEESTLTPRVLVAL